MKCVTIFSAQWCSACGPTKEALSKIQDEGLIHVTVLDVDKNIDAAQAAGIRGIPTMITEDGDRKTGGMSEVELRKWLEV